MNLTTRNLGDICDQVDGIIRTGPFGSQLHESDYVEDGVPVVMPKDIIECKVSKAGIAHIDETNATRLSQHRLEPGDIVYGRRGDIGRQALLREREQGWLCGTGCLRISLGKSVLEPLFLHYYLREPSVISWISQQAIGATLPNLNTSILRSIPITYPPLPTQRKIAAILSAYDDLIENNSRRIQLLETMAQALYREWFVNFRFPGHEQVKLVKSPLGMIPEGWEVKTIGDAISILSGYAFKSELFVKDGAYGLVTIRNVQDGLFITECQSQLQEIPAKMPSYCHLDTGDILLSLTGNIGRVCFVYGENYLLNQRVAKLSPHSPTNRAFTYFSFRLPELQTKLAKISNGVAQQNLSPIETAKMEFLCPSEDSLSKFSSIAEPIVDQMLALFRRNQNLRQTRDLLLPKLISGEVDVSALDINTAALAG